MPETKSKTKIKLERVENHIYKFQKFFFYKYGVSLAIILFKTELCSVIIHVSFKGFW